jgi:anthranilate synthase component 1
MLKAAFLVLGGFMVDGDFRYAYENGYDGIVLYKEIEGDMETPVTLLSKVLNSKNMFLLESAKEDKTYSRFSFLSFDLAEPIVITKDSNPNIFELKKMYKTRELGDFCGGYVGYFAFEAIELFNILREPLRKLPDNLGKFYKVEHFLVYDNYTDRLYMGYAHFFDKDINIEGNFDSALQAMESFHEKIKANQPIKAGLKKEAKIVASMFTKEEFVEHVKNIKQLIEDGEAIQVVVSNFFDVENLEPFEFYRYLRRINPSPYMYFIKNDGFYIVGSSPEIHIKKRDRAATIKPIAGTKPKGSTTKETELQKDVLISDEKERAEHLMLVDLARNDLSRVSKKDSVTVISFMQAEEYSHVIHLVSEVEGILKDNIGVFDLISNTFPAGTLSGAPKVRAIEIIDEIEKYPREAYGGCVGYVGFDSNIDLAITIRTAVFQNATARLQAGAGIVYDSDPESEYDETINKLKALLKAGGIYDSFDR